MSQKADKNVQLHRRSPHGERGLKFNREIQTKAQAAGRSPHGERGLKYHARQRAHAAARSLSSRRAWIEMYSLCSRLCWPCVALLTESVD